MKVGLFLTNQQHLETDMVSALGDQIAMVHHARDRGWNSLFSGQHYLNEGDNKQLQIVPFIARLIPEAGEMTTGLGVLLLNLHNPVYVAETVATLDIIAGGNFVFASASATAMSSSTHSTCRGASASRAWWSTSISCAGCGRRTR